MQAAQLNDLVARIANRDAPRTEADLQSDVKSLLLFGGLDLDEEDLQVLVLESPLGDGTRRRIDVEVGFSVIETKKSLKDRATAAKAVEQLAGYVKTRSEQTGRRYTGILTDGAVWWLYNLDPDGYFEKVDQHIVDAAAPNVAATLLWLEGVLATAQHLLPSPLEITRRLGAGSSGFKLDLASIRELYKTVRHEPEVKLKRELWARLLTTALGTQFEDSDDLFVDHTYLVTVAELVAHAAVGFPLANTSVPPDAFLQGTLFAKSGILGVVEADFFDWLIESGHAEGEKAGRMFASTLAKRLARFDWDKVDHDVLKALYESVISPEERHRLGEYYTPDWLAHAMVDKVVTAPLQQRVLDPSCGSGTFLFHAIRRFIAAAAEAGMAPPAIVSNVTTKVFGIDLHPVAVTLARVTYLLAIGKNLYQQRGPEGFSVPVFLGDSLQWSQIEPGTLWGSSGIHILTDDSRTLFSQAIEFPDSVLKDVRRFDALVSDLVAKASARKRSSAVPRLTTSFFVTHGVAEGDRAAIQKGLSTFCELHDQHRDHIWGYYVRNLARPHWLAREENRVDVLVGNPPWLAYRSMPPRMQDAFRTRGDALGIRPGGHLATHADLAAFFVVTAVNRYLRGGGTFGFVMPRSTIQGAHYAGFRTGAYSPGEPMLAVAFAKAWDLARVKPGFFPVPSCVVFGQRAGTAVPLGLTVEAWQGHLANPEHATIKAAAAALSRTDALIQSTSALPASPYHSEFRNGATLQPRMLTFVRDRAAGPLGSPAGRRPVVSRRRGDKTPWKVLPDLTGEVEEQFVFHAYLGENVAPYRILDHDEAVVPWDGKRLLDGGDDKLDLYPGLADWWREAERLWDTHGTRKMSLHDRIDFQGLLTAQFPVIRHKVVYAASGTYMAAARLDDPAGIIENRLWWRPAHDPDEARYLVAVLNSDTLLTEVIPLQPIGGFGTRHFHRYPLYPPVPRWDPANPTHTSLAVLAERAEGLAALVPPSAGFQKSRSMIREALREDGVWDEIESLVTTLITPL